MSEAPSASLILCARVLPDRAGDFIDWCACAQTEILAEAGVQSFEYWPPTPDQEEAVVLVRFVSVPDLRRWRASEGNNRLVSDASEFVAGGVVMQLAGQAAAEYYVQHSATEVIITKIKPGSEADYRAFADKIQKVQQTFHGYLGSFTQPPHEKEAGWTTVLRFDSAANLDAWLDSQERAALLKESETLIDGFHAQRVDTSFPGWAPVDPVTGKSPNMWKTASLVLLTLFPVVMLELKFLTPHLRMLNPALGTYIGNAISVALTTWPLMPLAIRAFHRWLFPEEQPKWMVLTSPAVLVLLYAIEIALLWRLL
ncbi:MAG: antibiotic biosynthesis monooxygenase [Vulcanimicrobiaceae bacterium]